MYVIKRNGREAHVAFDKITARINKLCYGLDTRYVDTAEIAQKVIAGLYGGITTKELDNLAAETAAYLTSKHPDYAILSARIAVSNLHKETKKNFSDVIIDLYNYVNPKNGKRSPLISDKTYKIVMDNADVLNSAIIYERDYYYEYFGFKTLERSYLLKIDGKVVERPSHMLMRVAVGIHGEDIPKAIETYDLLSQKYFTHATPTLFNAGTPKPSLSSCFLIGMKDDSVTGIFSTIQDCALISKGAGGIGLHVHNIRASGSYIAGTNGTSNGLVPMLKVVNNVARYIDQGGNKRPGAIAIYLEPWHADIFEFIDLRKNHGKEEVRARDLFYALWISDLFMKRVEAKENWTLMCPNECPGLSDCYGDEFDELYTRYEKEGKGRKTVPALTLWRAILDSQVETGGPFMLYKDAVNRKSNQKNLGTIKSSNLCTEIVQYSSPEEVSVCNLASLSLPAFVKDGTFDLKLLHKITKILTRNLNKVIDVTHYPLPEAHCSNMRHRPIALGVQGLADTFMKLRYPFTSQEAKHLNKQIFETIYFSAVEASVELAKEEGPYPSFLENGGCPMSKGILAPDMWNLDQKAYTTNDLWDWVKLREVVKEHGVRNSLLVGPMPTASTAQIFGNVESIEVMTSNLYVRRVLSGEFQITNKYLLKDLIELNLWNENTKNRIMANGGSIQNIPNIPQEIRDLYKTTWETSQKDILDMAADRAAFIDQTQSLNIHIADASFGKLSSMHFYGWKKGLKGSSYYIRTKAATDAIKFTVDVESLKEANEASLMCSIDNKEACLSCQ